MVNITVAAILKIHGKWIAAKEFVTQIHDKLEIGERQAYILINKAWKKKEIEKCVLPNRHVVYGLPEFGAPSEQDNAVKSDIPPLYIPYSTMDPMVAANVAQHDHMISLIDYCIKNKILDAEDSEFKKLFDLYKMSRNEIAVLGLWMKVTANMQGYSSLVEFAGNRARLNMQLDSLKKMLESK